jgi:hypothetical protein
MTATPAPPADKKNAPAGTVYVVLAQTSLQGGEQWIEIATETARSAKAAIRQALAGANEAGTFVAVPAKSWQPQKASPQTVTTLKLENA